MRPGTLAELAAGYGMSVPPIRGFGSFAAFAACTSRPATSCARPTIWLAWSPRPSSTPRPPARSGSSRVLPAPPFGAIRLARRRPRDRPRCCCGCQRDHRSRGGMDGQRRPHGRSGAGRRVGASRRCYPTGASCPSAWPTTKPAGRRAPSPRRSPSPGPGAAQHAPRRGTRRPASVISALEDLGADRIQHGVRAIEDPDLVRRLADQGTCLDVCPTSNCCFLWFRRWPITLAGAAGGRCALQPDGDDPLLFGPGLLDEYELVRSEMALDDAALAAIARTSIEASGAPVELKRRSLLGVETWLAGS